MPDDAPKGKYTRGVYVQLRAWNRETQKMEHLKGKGIRLYDWTPDEVQAILVRAFHEAAQREREKKQ